MAEKNAFWAAGVRAFCPSRLLPEERRAALRERLDGAACRGAGRFAAPHCCLRCAAAAAVWRTSPVPLSIQRFSVLQRRRWDVVFSRMASRLLHVRAALPRGRRAVPWMPIFICWACLSYRTQRGGLLSCLAAAHCSLLPTKLPSVKEGADIFLLFCTFRFTRAAGGVAACLHAPPSLQAHRALTPPSLPASGRGTGATDVWEGAGGRTLFGAAGRPAGHLFLPFRFW